MLTNTKNDTKIVQKFTNKTDEAYEFSLFVQTLILKKWYDIELSKEFIEVIIFMVKMGGEVNVENVINMLVPAIASRLGIVPGTQYESVCSRIYDVLIEANIESMIEVSINEMKNYAINESLPIDGLYH